MIGPDDEVFFLAASNNIPAVMAELRKAEKPFRRLIFAGGGNIGTRLARATERDFRVKIIERKKMIELEELEIKRKEKELMAILLR